MNMREIIEGQIKDLQRQLKIIMDAEKNAAKQEKQAMIDDIEIMINSTGLTVKEFVKMMREEQSA